MNLWDRSFHAGTSRKQLLVLIGLFLGTILLSLRPAPIILAGVIGVIGAIVLLFKPHLGLLAVIITALLIPVEINTGTEVFLNGTVFVIPVIVALWLVKILVRWRSHFVWSQPFIPLALFLGAGLISLLVGNVLWDPLVPKSSNFWIVQVAQWTIFSLSAIAFFLAANLITDESKLKQLIFGFLIIAGSLAFFAVLIGPYTLSDSFATISLTRTPFWILLASIAGGQLLFNKRIGRFLRLFSIVIMIAVFVYAFILQRQAVSNWVGIIVVVSTLVWLKYPRLRLAATILTILLLLTGILTQTIWEFGGGESEWVASGGSRIALATRVLEVTAANPITGLGPAAYRTYAAIEPLEYGRAFWVLPSVNSHNNYIDIYSQTGLIGLALFLWFMVSLVLLAWRLARKYQSGSTAGYVNGMIAAWMAIMVVMLLLDWFLPFVYNVGFPGFQASVLVWLFFGGLVAVDSWGSFEISDPE